MRKEYTLSDFFATLTTAQTKIKLGKEEKEYSYTERQIMHFTIDKLIPWNYSRNNRGVLTFEAFKNFKEVFQYLLPSISKANLKRIMYEARGQAGKIHRRRVDYVPYKQKASKLCNTRYAGIDNPYLHDNRLSMDVFYGAKYRTVLREKRPSQPRYCNSVHSKWEGKMDARYIPRIIQYVIDMMGLTKEDLNSSLSTWWSIYRDHGKTGLGVEAEWRKKGSYGYDNVFVKVKDLMKVEVVEEKKEEPTPCEHSLVPNMISRLGRVVQSGVVCEICRKLFL